MNKYKKLVQNSGIFMIGTFGSKFLTLLLVGLYTGVLTTSEYGTIDVFFTTTSLVVPIITIGILESVLRFPIDDIENRKKVLSIGTLVVLLGNMIFLVTIPVFLHIEIFTANLPMLYLLVFTNSMSSLFSLYCKGIGKTKLFALNGIIHTAIQIALNLLFLLVFKWGLKGYFYATVLSNFVSVIILFLWAKLYELFEFKIDKGYMKQMFVYGLPLIPNNVFWWIMQCSNRYVILYALGESFNGIYSVAHKLPTIISSVSSIFFKAWQLSSAEEDKSEGKNEFYNKVFSIVSPVVIILTSGTMFILQPFYKIWVNETYYMGYKAVPFLLIGTVFSCFSSFLGANYTASKKTGNMLCTTIIGAFVNLIVSFLLVKPMEINGVALATALGFFATFIVMAIDTRKFVIIKYSLMKFIVPMLIITVQAIVLTIGNKSIVLQAIFVLALFLIYARDMISIVKTLSQKLKSRRK